MKSRIIIYKYPSSENYYATVTGKWGGGYLGCFVAEGHELEKVAAFAANEINRYGRPNPEGFDFIAPPEIKRFFTPE